MSQATVWHVYFDDYTQPVMILAPDNLSADGIVRQAHAPLYEQLVASLEINEGDDDAGVLEHFQRAASQAQLRLLERGPRVWLAS